MITERYIVWYRKTSGTRNEWIDLPLWFVFLLASAWYCWRVPQENRDLE